MESTHPLPAKPSPPNPRRRRYWLFFVSILLLVAIVVALKNKKKPVFAGDLVQTQTPNIRVATATHGEIGKYIEGLGTVTPLATVNVYRQVNGQVMDVHYVEGQIVRRGDLLIDIDPRPYEAQLHQYEGQLQRDQALLKQAEIDFARYHDASRIPQRAAQSTCIWATTVILS